MALFLYCIPYNLHRLLIFVMGCISYVDKEGPHQPRHAWSNQGLLIYQTKTMTQIWLGWLLAPDKALFSTKKYWYFSYFCTKYVCRGYSLEMPHWDTSNGYPQYIFVQCSLELPQWGNSNKKSAESDVTPVGIKSYKFLFVLKKICFAVFKKLMG